MKFLTDGYGAIGLLEVIGPIPTSGVSHGTDCFVKGWYNDQRSFRVLPLRGGSRRMATLLLIDDDPDLLRDRVRHVLPAPAHRSLSVIRDVTFDSLRINAGCSPREIAPNDQLIADGRLPGTPASTLDTRGEER